MNRFSISILILISIFISIFISTPPLQAQSPSTLPLFHLSDLNYQGAFRISAATFGSSSLNYSEGPIAYNPDNHSLFIVGHSHHQEIAEFFIPPLVLGNTISNLNMADSVIQTFSSVLDNTHNGNPEGLDRIGGLMYFSNASQLLVNAYEYYDAPGNNSLTTLMARKSDSLDSCVKNGYLEFEGGAGHTSGWISPIPIEWRDTLGGTHITGQSSGIPIISRTSVGPSAFVFDSLDLLVANTGLISTTTLLDYSLQDPLHSDLSNASLANGIWTHLSRVTYGFIVPGTRTYFTMGYSGGHQSGVCYKCTQNDGNLCGGYCPPDTSDQYQFYWLWDLNDLCSVKAGALLPHQVQPYAYGEFNTPFQTDQREIGGGSFDPVNNLLYLSLQRADYQQGTYARPPLMVVYEVPDNQVLGLNDDDFDNGENADKLKFDVFPNPSAGIFEIKGLQENSKIRVSDMTGRIVESAVFTKNEKHYIDLSGFPDGMYMLKIIMGEKKAKVFTRKLIKKSR